MVKWDGFDNAIIGTAERHGMDTVIAYDLTKMVKILVARDDMSVEEAHEYLQFNVIGAYIGEYTPIIVNKMTVKELMALLQEMDPDLEVFVASDEEGNSFKPLYSCSESKFMRYGREIEIIHPDDVTGAEKDCVTVWP